MSFPNDEVDFFLPESYMVKSPNDSEASMKMSSSSGGAPSSNKSKLMNVPGKGTTTATTITSMPHSQSASQLKQFKKVK
jgi:hypothetical protein